MANDASSTADYPHGPPTYIGCAGWSLPRAMHPEFPDEGDHLMRYAGRLNAVEINSTFYRPHRVQTYARWAASVPDHFAFSVKLPRQITHERRLLDATEALGVFAGEVAGLGEKLRCLLIQLPPSLKYERVVAERFFADVRHALDVPAVVEARHASWFGSAAGETLEEQGIGRVVADPPAVPLPVHPTAPIRYHRMHGSPRIYYSPYDRGALAALAEHLAAARRKRVPGWCIFDNTALGHATADALALTALVPRVP